MYNGPKKNIRMVFQQQPPPVWYKDQAHEPKYFCVVVMLKDEGGRRVKGLDVPLKAKLMFANGEVVNRQGILKLSKDSVPAIGNSGVAELKIRIDSVSKNHDGRLFMVNIFPDARCLPADVRLSGTNSHPVKVLSKRNRGKRKKDSHAFDSDSLTAVASWCRFAYDVMGDISSSQQLCPVCDVLAPKHTENCKLYKCREGYRHISGLFDQATTKKQKTTGSKIPSCDLKRMPSTDLKRHKSPALLLENVHNCSNLESICLPGSDFIPDLFNPPPLIKSFHAPPILQRKKSG
mmetsp:Transcript_13684/g.24711  ORF Transcript_13684/g.24711 Transcript_13684/m.24711 type:complete len:291 (+) Transcript_13684:118-990(+)